MLCFYKQGHFLASLICKVFTAARRFETGSAGQSVRAVWQVQVRRIKHILPICCEKCVFLFVSDKRSQTRLICETHQCLCLYKDAVSAGKLVLAAGKRDQKLLTEWDPNTPTHCGTFAACFNSVWLFRPLHPSACMSWHNRPRWWTFV